MYYLGRFAALSPLCLGRGNPRQKRDEKRRVLGSAVRAHAAVVICPTCRCGCLNRHRVPMSRPTENQPAEFEAGACVESAWVTGWLSVGAGYDSGGGVSARPQHYSIRLLAPSEGMR